MNSEAKRTAKIGLIQVQPFWKVDEKLRDTAAVTVDECLDEMLHLAELCLKDGADLVFMPESYQYKNDRRVPQEEKAAKYKELIAKYAADYKRRCSNLAVKYGAYVVPWDLEVDSEGRLYNTSYILDRKGVEVGRYRKVQLGHGEDYTLTPGNDFPVFDLDFGKVGIMICFDNYFVESARILGLRGAELILYPLFGDTLKENWEIKLKARALDNSLYVASCLIDSVPEEGMYSGIVSPDGEVIARVEKAGTHQVVEIDIGHRAVTGMSGTNSVRREYVRDYLLKQRNPRAYQPILEHFPERDWEEILFTIAK